MEGYKGETHFNIKEKLRIAKFEANDNFRGMSLLSI